MPCHAMPCHAEPCTHMLCLGHPWNYLRASNKVRGVQGVNGNAAEAWGSEVWTSQPSPRSKTVTCCTRFLWGYTGPAWVPISCRPFSSASTTIYNGPLYNTFLSLRQIRSSRSLQEREEEELYNPTILTQFMSRSQPCHHGYAPLRAAAGDARSGGSFAT